MTIVPALNDGVMTVTVDGEINTLTAPELAKTVMNLTGVSFLVFDLDRVPYVSSAGLRVFLDCQRRMQDSGGDMKIRNCSEFVIEIFESVGYHQIMKVEKKIPTGETDAGSEQ